MPSVHPVLRRDGSLGLGFTDTVKKVCRAGLSRSQGVLPALECQEWVELADPPPGPQG